MEKFGLDSLLPQKNNNLELEIAKEKATALGLAGKRLKQSLEAYRSEPTTARERRESLLARVAESLSELLIQRELTGVPHENSEWVLRTFDIPPEVLVKLGLKQGGGKL